MSIERTLILALICTMIVMGTITKITMDRNDTLQSRINDYKAEIANLDQLSQEQAERYEEAQRSANKQMRQIQEQARLILATKVPKGCEEAIKWGLNEARRLA